MKLPQESELLTVKIQFYKLMNFYLSIGVLVGIAYGVYSLGKVLFG